MKPTSVSFIGSGNLAWHLAPAFDNTDFSVREVFSKNHKHASALVERLYQATTKTSLDFSDSPSGIFVIAVSDDVIGEIAQNIILPANAILLHTSGSQPLSKLTSAGIENIGVFYPLQTFSKQQKIDFKEVPIFIESENTSTEKLMMAMAKSISKNVVKISSAHRKVLHVAAVFASNFTNHMLTIAKEILQDNNVNFDYLKPLIVETIHKSLSLGPEYAQTGPAKRGDLEILDKHMDLLKHDEQVAEIYKVISQHIVDQYAVE